MEDNQFQELKTRDTNECLLVWIFLLFVVLFAGLFVMMRDIDRQFKDIRTKLELIEFKVDDINRQKVLDEVDLTLDKMNIG